jgi:hypothetical protein
MRCTKWRSVGLTWLFGLLFLLAASPARPQVATLGKGWLLDVAGTITSASGEVISGRNSIKGSYSGPNVSTQILISDNDFVHFTPNRTYTMTFKPSCCQMAPSAKCRCSSPLTQSRDWISRL